VRICWNTGGVKTKILKGNILHSAMKIIATGFTTVQFFRLKIFILVPLVLDPFGPPNYLCPTSTDGNYNMREGQADVLSNAVRI
jgi:hypothetical protein